MRSQANQRSLGEASPPPAQVGPVRGFLSSFALSSEQIPTLWRSLLLRRPPSELLPPPPADDAAYQPHLRKRQTACRIHLSLCRHMSFASAAQLRKLLECLQAEDLSDAAARSVLLPCCAAITDSLHESSASTSSSADLVQLLR